MAKSLSLMFAAIASAAVLSGCGKEDAASSAPSDTSNLPPFPAWALPLIGAAASPDYDQSKACLGHFDVVSAIHKGDRPGFEVGGWAWDTDAAAPAARLVIADASGRIVGAAEGGVLRPDVPKVLPKVTSTNTGWHGLVAAKGGKVTALAILKSGKQCDAGSFQLPDDY